MDIIGEAHLVSTITQASNEHGWLEARTSGIGGSDIGAICGVSNWKNANDIYYSKINPVKVTSQGNAAYWGSRLEHVVADEAVKQLRDGQEAIHEVLETTGTYARKDAPHMRANFDRVLITAEGPVILECKTAGGYAMQEWENGDIPKSYVYQVQWYMMVAGIPRAYIACLVAGQHFFMYQLFKNTSLQNDMRKAADTFWFEHVLKGVPPIPEDDIIDGVVATPETKYLGDSTELLKKYAELQRTKRVTEKQLSEMKAQILSLLDGAERGYCDGISVVNKAIEVSRFDTQAFKIACPDVAAQYTRKDTNTRLTIKEV